MAPTQVRVLPLSDKFLDYANTVTDALKKGGTQSKTLHELRMKKQHKNRAKKASKKRRPGL